MPYAPEGFGQSDGAFTAALPRQINVFSSHPFVPPIPQTWGIRTLSPTWSIFKSGAQLYTAEGWPIGSQGSSAQSVGRILLYPAPNSE